MPHYLIFLWLLNTVRIAIPDVAGINVLIPNAGVGAVCLRFYAVAPLRELQSVFIPLPTCACAVTGIGDPLLH